MNAIFIFLGYFERCNYWLVRCSSFESNSRDWTNSKRKNKILRWRQKSVDQTIEWIKWKNLKSKIETNSVRKTNAFRRLKSIQYAFNVHDNGKIANMAFEYFIKTEEKVVLSGICVEYMRWMNEACACLVLPLLLPLPLSLAFPNVSITLHSVLWFAII